MHSISGKRFTTLLATILAGTLAALAQPQAEANGISLLRQGQSVQLNMNVSVPAAITKQQVMVLTPRLVGPADSIDFPSIGFVGRQYYYYSVRAGVTPMFSGNDIIVRAKGALPLTEHYAKTLPYQPWMDRAQLWLVCRLVDCCGQRDADWERLLMQAQTKTITTPPTYLCIEDSVESQAFVNFIVDRTEIRPDYMDNRRELERIGQTIASIQGDTANTLTAMHLKGFASPEAPYEHNAWLAQHRTEALKQYILEHSTLTSSQITTSFEPEDWAGLRQYVMNHPEMKHQRNVLAIIDGPLEPDARLAAIAQRYPAEYRWLLTNCFPRLRRTDYSISYTHRTDSMRPGTKRTVYRIPQQTLGPNLVTWLQPRRPVAALKSNLLFDMALCLNIEAEVELGRASNYSLMAEFWTPWYVWHHNSRAYELQTLGLELRHYNTPHCLRPAFSGGFTGLYAAAGRYDFEWHSQGDQGEFISAGATAGYSWVLSHGWNFEASASIGAVWGPRSHYHGADNDTHLLWQHDGHIFYLGPTKLKLSLVWLLPEQLFKKKGGQR